MRCKLLTAAFVAATFTIAGEVANAPPAQARAIEVSASSELRINNRREEVRGRSRWLSVSPIGDG